MPYKNKEDRKANKKAYYQKNKEKISTHKKGLYYKNKPIVIEHLGGKCVRCGTTENLEFDHIVRKQKNYPITDRLRCSEKKLKKMLEEGGGEVNKCQLLCKKCHRLKTNEENRSKDIK